MTNRLKATPKRILMTFIRTYRQVLSPLLPPRCRYIPTCSEYALEALEIHGFFRGSYLAIKRLLRCHPWGRSGYDPVPPADGCCQHSHTHRN